MPKIINIRILTNEGEAINEEALSIRAPGDRGYIGMLFNHAPLVTTMEPGKFTWKTPEGKNKAVSVGAGMLEIVTNNLTLLTDFVENSSSPSK